MTETAATVVAFALAVATLAAAPHIAIRVPMGAISEREYPITAWARRAFVGRKQKWKWKATTRDFFDPARISNPNEVVVTFATRMIVERLPVGYCIRFTVCVDHDTAADGMPIRSEVVHKIVIPVRTFFRSRLSGRVVQPSGTARSAAPPWLFRWSACADPRRYAPRGPGRA
jgi:hypothetical protein